VTMQRTDTVRVRVCQCGHEEEWHSGQAPARSCMYGHTAATGGCDCVKFRSRGRAGVRALLVPPTTTIDTIIREMVRSEVAKQFAAARSARVTAEPAPARRILESRTPVRHTNGSVPLQGIDRKLLQALATHGPSSVKRLAILAGYSQSGTFSAAITRLRRGGYIVSMSGSHAITDLGRPLVSVGPLPTGQALMDYWSSRLGSCGTSILEVLVRAYPLEVKTAELAEATHYKASGTFSATQTKLRHLGLVDGHRASREFVEAVRGGAS